MNADDTRRTDDEWTEQINAAFPTRSGSHDAYATAMRMVGNRHAKSDLVALVNWLLMERDALERERKVSAAALDYIRAVRECNTVVEWEAWDRLVELGVDPDAGGGSRQSGSPLKPTATSADPMATATR